MARRQRATVVLAAAGGLRRHDPRAAKVASSSRKAAQSLTFRGAITIPRASYESMFDAFRAGNRPRSRLGRHPSFRTLGTDWIRFDRNNDRRA